MTAIALIALILRLLACVATHAASRPGGEEQIIADRLLAGDGFSFIAFTYTGPTSVRGPFEPFLLAGVRAIAGNDGGIWIVLAINAIAGALTTALAFDLARRVGASTRAACGLAIALAIWPTQLYAATFLQPLPIAIALSLAALCLLDRARLNSILSLPAAACAALALLGEPILFLPLATAAVLLVRQRLRVFAISAAVAALLIAPWLYRNAIVHDGPTGITNTLAANLFVGNSPDATGSVHRQTQSGRPHRLSDDLTPQRFDALRGASEADRNHLLWKWAVESIQARPLRYAILCVTRFGETLWLDPHHPDARHALAYVPRTLALAASLLTLLIRRNRISQAACGVAFAIALAAAPTLAEARNAVFMDVPQLLAAATLLDWNRRSSDTQR